MANGNALGACFDRLPTHERDQVQAAASEARDHAHRMASALRTAYPSAGYRWRDGVTPKGEQRLYLLAAFLGCMTVSGLHD